MLGLILRAGLVGGTLVGGAVAARDYLQYSSNNEPISQGGTPHGTLTGRIMGYRHLIAMGIRNIAHPERLHAMFTAEGDARKAEHTLFRSGEKNGYDNGPDAFRHTYASALIVSRLVRNTGMNIDDAIELARDAGMAHENDSHLVGPHYLNSRRMDVHNNELGYRLATEALRRNDAAGFFEARLGVDVLNAIRTRQAVVLDHIDLAPRPSNANDIDRGTPIPDAPGWTSDRAHRRVGTNRKPLVIAHRGLHDNQTIFENTAASMKAAVAAGADVIETDVHRTRDGVLVIHHDPVVRGKKIEDYNHSELVGPDGYHLPRLEEIIDIANTGNVGLAVELKGKGYEKQVVDLLSSRLANDRFEVTSFNTSSIKAVEQYRPSTRTGLLSPRIFPWLRESFIFPFAAEILDPLQLPLRRAAKAGADYIAVDRRQLSERLLEGAQRRGIDVDVWTLNEESDLVGSLSNSRIRGVITDRPQEALTIRRGNTAPTLPF